MQVLSILVLILLTQNSFAQSGSTVSTPSVSSSASTSTTVLPMTAPRIGNFKVKAGWQSLHNSGRVYEYGDKTKRVYKLKSEYFGGLVHDSGWGMTALAVTGGTGYVDPSKDQYGAGDPSLTLIHPSYYESSSLKVGGQLRRYFAVTDRSKNRNQQQYAYYLLTRYKMASDWAIFNQYTPRYFVQSYYKKDDTNYLMEDIFAISKKMNSWLKLGAGAHSQIEWHDKTSPGTSVEVYPLANFFLSDTLFVETRVRLPVHKVNAVYDAPEGVALDNAQAEVFMQIAI